MKGLSLKLFSVTAAAAIVFAFQPLGQAQSSLSDGMGQHLFYVGTDQHIHQFYSFASEHDMDLFRPGNGQPAFDFGHGAPLTSFSDNAGEHVYYFDSNGFLHRLFWNAKVLTIGMPVDGLWEDSFLLTPTADVGVHGVAGFSDAAGEQVFFVSGPSTSLNVQWLSCPQGGNCNTSEIVPGNPAFGSWSSVSLTQLTGAPPVASGLSAFVDSNGEHLLYVASDQTVNEFFRAPGGNWVCQNLTVLSMIDTPWGFIFTHFAVRGSSLTGFSDRTGQHVIYVDANEHVNQLFQSPGGPWVNQDLTAMTGGTPAAMFSGQLQPPLTSFSNGTGEHIFYVDTNGRVDQLFVPWGGAWIFQPALDNAPAVDHCSGLTSFSDPTGEFVSFISGAHIFQLSFTGGASWNAKDFTAQFGGPGASYSCFF